ncbi:MAG: DUF3990 domain-containing protein [Clostridia bacterium]|nr:DUF3990 domain-containing protein [Clostridia bacterium]
MSQELSTTLYHGSISEITAIDVNKGRPLKDFGKGFYMAVSKKQAIGMMHKKYHEALKRCEPDEISEHLYEITLDEQVIRRLNVKVFSDADAEWLDFVLMCRKSEDFVHGYDMVIGPTADDNINRSFNFYEGGDLGEIGSVEAKNTLLHFLQAEKLGIQYFIGKQEIADAVVLSVRETEWRKQ